MNKFNLIPKSSIGNISLGMSRDMVHEILGNKYFEMFREGVLSDSYDDILLKVCYEKDIVNFIEISNDSGTNVFYDNINIFQTKADDLVAYLKQYSDYLDTSDAEWGFAYIFEELGISLYRTGVTKEESINEPWFQELSDENKEYELRYLYFEAVAVFGEGYYDSVKNIILNH